jgi:hypothetical protein
MALPARHSKMKKLILAILVIATFGVNATQLTKEQQARVDKFNSI